MVVVKQLDGAMPQGLGRTSRVARQAGSARRRNAVRRSAAVGAGRKQPLNKSGSFIAGVHPQQPFRPRSEVSNEPHSAQNSQVQVVERQEVEADSHNGHTNGISNGHSNGHLNGHGNGQSNGHPDGYANGKETSASAPQSSVAVVEPPTKQNDSPLTNGALASDAVNGVKEALLKSQGFNKNGSVSLRAQVAAGKKRQTRVNPIPADISKVRVTSAQVLAFVLGGGQGSELYPLTQKRAEPAVPLFGSYRLIDVPLSNCLNSSVPINKVYVLTQFNSTPLNRHLATAYNFVNSLQFSNDMSFVEPLNATLTNMKEKDKDWFRGTADAVRHYAWTLNDPRLDAVQDVVILSGDQIYRMDYTELIQYHRYTHADITMGCTPCTRYEAEQFGLCTLNKELRVVGFNEKPRKSLLESLAMDTTVLGLTEEEAAAKPYAANMGVYVFKKQVLLDLLKDQPEASDFSRDIITNSIGSMDDVEEATGPLYNIMAYPFRGYWRDVGSLKSYFHANLDTTVPQGASFPLRMRDKPLYTEARVLPPAKMAQCDIQESVVGHGSVLKGCSVIRSVLGDCTTIREGSIVEDTIIFGSTHHEDATDLDGTKPLLGVGSNCRLRGAILDKNARIGNNSTLVNQAGVVEAFHEELGYVIRDGIICILRGATIPAGTVI